MTRDELRADILDGIARLENTFLWMRMTDTQKSVAKAQAQYWQQAPDADLDKLLSLVQAQPAGKAIVNEQEAAQKLGITLPNIDWTKVLAIVQAILQILAIQKARRQAAGCDAHEAAMHEAACLNFQAAVLCLQCCCDNPEPCPTN